MLRSLMRRKLRTTLTVLGITVGIWTLIVMSAMANKLTTLVDGGSTYFDEKIVVSDATNPAFGFGYVPMPVGIVDQIGQVPGVAVAATKGAVPPRPRKHRLRIWPAGLRRGVHCGF